MLTGHFFTFLFVQIFCSFFKLSYLSFNCWTVSWPVFFFLVTSAFWIFTTCVGKQFCFTLPDMWWAPPNGSSCFSSVLPLLSFLWWFITLFFLFQGLPFLSSKSWIYPYVFSLYSHIFLSCFLSFLFFFNIYLIYLLFEFFYWLHFCVFLFFTAYCFCLIKVISL